MITRAYVAGRFGQIHYREAGARDDRPSLVLLHQNPSSSLEYEPLIAEMSRDRHVVALDTPGYGMSDAPPAPLDMAGYAACFAEALRTIGLGGPAACDLYGFHTGALLAIETALALPDAVRRVVVTGLPMRTDAERAERLALAQNAPPLDEAGDVALDMARTLWDYVVAARTAGVPLDRAARVWIDKLTPLDRVQWAYHGVWRYDFAGRLPLLRQSTLLLQPAEALLAQSKAAAALMPSAHIVEMPDLARDIFDAPGAVARIGDEMRRFLDTPDRPFKETRPC